MNFRRDNNRFLYIFTIFICVIIFIAYLYIEKKETSLYNDNYTKLANDIKASINTIINNKMNSTAAVVIPIANSDKLKNALQINTFNNLKYDNLKYKLRENTNYKNLWIEIFDDKLNSVYRSWTDDKSFSDFENKNFKPFDKIKKSIEVTWYGLTFKATTPIFDREKKLGYIQSITKFNSIAKSIEKQGFIPIVVVNKNYKNVIKKPFTKSFIGDYYIANLGASDEILSKLDEQKIDDLKKTTNYKVFEEYFITRYKIKNGLGYIFAFKKLEDIDTKSINNFKQQAFLLVFIILFLLIFIVSIYSYRSYTKNIKKLNTNLLNIVKRLRRQRNKTQLLLDSQSSIIVITDGEEIVNANRQLLEFFTDCKSLLEFKEKYTCVCTAFIKMDDENYLLEKDYDGLNWAEYVMDNPNRSFKAAMYNQNNELIHFKVSVAQKSFDSYIIATLVDITHEINLQKQAQEKDKLIFQQSKMSSIAEILHNIAHHWRQPLNVITTASSSLKLYKQLGELDENLIYKNCDLIADKANYLSKTIDDFRDFFLIDNVFEKKNISTIIKQTVDYLDVLIEEKEIDIRLHLDESVEKEILENEFKQALLKILDNSIELLTNRKDIDDRAIIIELTNKALVIKDSANGVSNDNLDKLFEPYFTTKHKAQGVGLGLYTVQQIFTKQMDFSIEANNCSFEYNNKLQKGLEITISF